MRKALVIDNFDRQHFFPIGEEVELIGHMFQGMAWFRNSQDKEQLLLEGEFEWISLDSAESQEAEKTQSETF